MRKMQNISWPYRFLALLLAGALSAGCGKVPTDPDDAQDGAPGGLASDPLKVSTLASGLDTPWDLVWGPDNQIWVTERRGTISRVDTSLGRITRVGQIDIVEQSESGLMGMAFHPDFETLPFVYLAHSYRSGSGIQNRLVRMRYDGTRLGNPEVLLDNISGAPNHDGSRLAIGPDRLLYMTTGDAQNQALPRACLRRKTPLARPSTGDLFGRQGPALYLRGPACAGKPLWHGRLPLATAMRRGWCSTL